MRRRELLIFFIERDLSPFPGEKRKRVTAQPLLRVRRRCARHRMARTKALRTPKVPSAMVVPRASGVSFVEGTAKATVPSGAGICFWTEIVGATFETADGLGEIVTDAAAGTADELVAVEGEAVCGVPASFSRMRNFTTPDTT